MCADVSKEHLSAINSLPGGLWACTSCRVAENDNNNADKNNVTPISRRTPDVKTTSVGQETREQPQVTTLVKSMLTEIQTLRESVEFLSNMVTDFEGKLTKFNELMKSHEAIKQENTQLRKEVSTLSKRVDNMENLHRANNIEIHDIPEKSNENLSEVISKIGAFLGCPLDKNAIDSVFRVQTLNPNKPKNIVVKFTSKTSRDLFLTNAKHMRRNEKFNRGFKLEGLAEKFFINEHLSSATKVLLKETKETAKRNSYKFVWVQNGNILVRKNEASKLIQISKSKDLDQL